MRLGEQSIGAQAYARHRAKKFKQYSRLPDSARDKWNLRTIDKGKSAYYSVFEYNKGELAHICDTVTRYNRIHPVQFQVFKTTLHLEVARIA